MAVTYLQDPQTGWTLRVFGEFDLTDRAGRPVLLPNRKVEGLLAVLIVYRDFGLRREELGEILWQDRPEVNQRTNLRQTVSLLRKTLGEAAVESSRSHVRLTNLFFVECDYHRKDLRRGVGFMPGHDGDWFDQIRLEEAGESGWEPPALSLHSGFLETLQLLAANDPRGMFGLMRSNPAICRDIAYQDLKGLLSFATPTEKTIGWSDFWKGTVTDDLHLSANLLRSALRHAKTTEDFDLASEVCLELGRAYIRTGNIEKAERICSIADSVAERSRSNAARANAARLRGTHLVNWGDPLKGLSLIEGAEEYMDDPFARIHLQAVRAFFAASVGQHAMAHTVLQAPLAMAPRLGISSVEYLITLTKAILTISGGKPEDAIFDLERIRAKSYSLQVTQIGVYADEMLAKVFALSGEKALAHNRMTSARQGRQASRMVQTKVEADRIKLLR